MLIGTRHRHSPAVPSAAEALVLSRDASRSSLLRSAAGAALVDSVEQARRRYRDQPPEFVLLDVTCDDELAALGQLRMADPDIPIIVVLRRGSTGAVVQAMKLGAADVVCAPFESVELESAVSNVLERRQATRDASTLRREVRSQDKHTMLFGSGLAMAELRALIARVVDVDVPVLIQGETGTGKELVARALAAPSLKRGKPFVKINCAALPGELFEAELFGYEQGAFTGAVQAKPGRFELADGGTLFLDEIGEIPLHLQAKLLQAVQDGHFCRLGGRGEIRTSVRIIAATNRDLRQAAADGTFREDLLFRLNVIPMYVPPLRERRQDIPGLAEFFSKRWAVFYDRPYTAMSPALMRDWLQYGWPGNIRELENVIQRNVVLGASAAQPARLFQRPSHAPIEPNHLVGA